MAVASAGQQWKHADKAGSSALYDLPCWGKHSFFQGVVERLTSTTAKSPGMQQRCSNHHPAVHSALGLVCLAAQ